MGYTTSNITGDSVAANVPDAIRALWNKGVEVWEQSTDFFAPMEGGSNALIETITDTSKGRGQSITFTQMSGLYMEPKLGDQLFEDGDAFEGINLHTYDLKVDYLRHGVRYTERTEEFMGMRGEIVAGLPDELGKWLGRQKTEKMSMSLLHRGDASNRVFANGKGSAEALLSADSLGWDTIVASQTQLQRLGGRPASVGKDANGNPINRYVIVATTDALFSLEMDDDFKTLAREADVRGMSNVIFQGGWQDVRGNMIKAYNPIDHDGIGAIGSPFNPKALLGVATNDGFTSDPSGTPAAGYIYGGGNAANAMLTGRLYFKYFPLYQFRFLANDTLSLASSLYGSGSFYVGIFNPPGSPTDAGKFGFYKVSANNGNKLTVEEKLSSSHNLTNITWNSAIHTNVHPENAQIYLVNSKGVPFGHSLALAKQAARRGYGKHRNSRTEDEHEGGFVRDVFITTVFGQEPTQDAAGRKVGYLIITHALQIAGVPFPVVS